MSVILSPDGVTPLRPEIVALRPEEMLFVAQFHTLAQKYRWALGCPICKSNFEAKNGPGDRVWAFTCKCREFRAEVRSGRPS